MDSNLGHTRQNSVACCERCNFLLSDIPYSAKLLLKPGLQNIYSLHLLKAWVIPTKRHLHDTNSKTIQTKRNLSSAI